MTTLQKVELLAPAGSFEAAIKAVEAGADAIYLGLQTFSARKAARNFDMMQLRRLLTETKRMHVRVFLTLNTLILQSEMEDALQTILEVHRIGVDAVIVQDVGFAALIQKVAPHIELHASTQMAVHNIPGVLTLQKLGISRVVLARELTPAQVARIHKAVPDVELEVFIHGALCYSFSGVCFASGMEAGRSANRGECAQFCRSRYDMERAGEGFFFSCSDLVLHEDIERYIVAGAVSLKIEGRMKSPSFVYHTTKLYRALLDKQESEQLKQNSAIVFARQQAKPYINKNRGERLIDSLHPGHRGVLLGQVKRVTKEGAVITPSHTISVHDGILYHIDGDPMHPFRGGILAIYEKGRETRFSAAGKEVAIVTKQLPKEGDKLFLVSSRNLDVPLRKEGSISPIKKGVVLIVNRAESSLEVRYNDFVYSSDTLPFERATGEGSLEKSIATIFKKSGEAFYFAEEIEFVGDFSRLFVPPSALKSFRAEFFHALESWWDEKSNRAVVDALAFLDDSSFRLLSEDEKEFFSHRMNLNPHTPTLGKDSHHLPYAFVEHLRDSERFARFNNNIVIPLLPILPEPDLYTKALEQCVAQKESHFLIGISNIAHIEMVKKLDQTNITYFLDFPIYLANRAAFDSFVKLLFTVPLFGYHWIEDKKSREWEDNFPLITNQDPSAIPLFSATGCLEKSLNNDKCPADCPLSFSRRFSNQGREYLALTYHCVTMTFRV